MVFEQYLDWAFLGNSGAQYAAALAAFVFAYVAFWVFRSIVLSRLERLAKRTKFAYDDFVVEFLEEVRPPFYLIVSFYFGSLFISLDALLRRGIELAAIAAVTYYAVKGLQRVVTFTKNYVAKKRRAEDGEEDTSLLDTAEAMAHAVIWIVAILFVLDTIGFDVTVLLAGLGIGGIAIAIASQAVLSDLLAALSIYFDKPFKVGDFIIVGNDMGVVRRIGIKTTRIQTLQGQELVMSNQELTSSRVNNYKRMEKRRIVFGFGVVYGTPVSKLKRIPAVVRGIIDSVALCSTDRVHFKAFGQSSLDFEAVYYFSSPDYSKYMDAQQDINLKVSEAFEKDKIEFAFPTQTVYLKQ